VRQVLVAGSYSSTVARTSCGRAGWIEVSLVFGSMVAPPVT